MKLQLNIDSATSYKNECTLDKSIERKFPGLNYLTVCNRDGRFTAIFPLGSNPTKSDAPIIFDVTHAGFIITN